MIPPTASSRNGDDPPPEPTSRIAAVTVGTVARLRAIQHRTASTDLAALVDEVCALEDRLTYAESAVAHLCDRLSIDPHALPDALVPRIYVPPADAGEVPS
jgi:hypothetical protein